MLREIPVVIVSSERARGEACVQAGAAGYLAKPVRADEMVAMIGRVIEASREKRAREATAIIVVGVGPLEVGIPLELVQLVTWQPETIQLPASPSYVSEFFVLRGEAVCVLDLAARFGVDHTKPVVDRVLVVVEYERVKLALCADGVHDPEAVMPAEIQQVTPEQGLAGALRAVVKTSHGAMPVLHPPALLSRGLVRRLAELVKNAGAVPA